MPIKEYAAQRRMECPRHVSCKWRMLCRMSRLRREGRREQRRRDEETVNEPHVPQNACKSKNGVKKPSMTNNVRTDAEERALSRLK